MSKLLAHEKIKYIYDLPFRERTELCNILNQNSTWEQLAGIWMKYDVSTIYNLRKERNPTDELLSMWSIHNHTILELFILLSKMKHYRAMIILKSFVNNKYHVLIDNCEKRVMNLLNNQNFQTVKEDIPEGTPKLNKKTSCLIDISTNVTPNQPNVKIVNNLKSDDPSNSNNSAVASPLISPGLVHVKLSDKLNKLSMSKTHSVLPQISYDELMRATDGWNKRYILGRGGFGIVYKGTWKNTDVAIKKIERRGPESDEKYMMQLQQSLREITILNSRPHENILSLYAFSIGGGAPCLVYQFMRNGSLEDRLQIRHNTRPLTWIQRHEIAKGTARGLQYLHTIGEKPLIHGDIKSANILLDKNMEPKIGDFGLAREGLEKDAMKVSKVHGTRPYLPDELLREKNLSTKTDTYSYGIVLFELGTGLPAYDDSRPVNKFLKEYMDTWDERNYIVLIDRKAGLENSEVFHNLMVLGKWCSDRLVEKRPEMDFVYRKLDDL
ncbi:pelle-like serine/threonine-protein kinase pik-1 [Chelonus insularis]|uniref:pelle-like serine/threonine-protein kinase pik-1 n=1 Tax=Chelonus insularis TaxID=460826 RepID=UPI00158E7B23|nr:pelle-like serine/threonine-protein kinase pik-1 [Chelonus insularis]